MSAILAPAMSESPTGTVESTLSSATSGPSSTLPPPLIKNLSNIQQLSRSNSIGSFTTTSATPQTLQQTPLQLLQKKVSMTSVGGSNLSRQQSFSVPNLDQGVVGPPASVHQPSGLSQGQPLVPHMYRADSERDETASADGPRGFPKESRISAEFFQETLDSVADLLRPSARGMSGSGSNLGVGGGRDLFFRPASFQLDPSLKPSDVGFSALSIAELATMGAEESGEVLESRHNLEGGRPRSEHGGKREGFVGHARTPAARLETNLSASDLLMGSSIGGSYAPTFAMDSSFLAQAMSSDDADEAYAVHHQPIQRPSQPLQRQDSGQRLSSTSPVGPIEKSRLSTTSTISSNMRNSINLDKDFDMYGSGVRPRTSSLSSNNSFRKSLEIMGTRTSPYAESFSRPLSTISSPGIDQPSSTTSETPDHRAPHQHHQTHATNQSCPAAWRSVGSLSDGPATTSTNTAPSMPGRSPTHGTTTYPRSTPQQPTHTRRQSEGGVTTKAIPLTTALTASSSSSISPQIETPQRPRLGPFWLSQEKHTSLQSTMDPTLFSLLLFSIGPPKDLQDPQGMTLGRPDVPAIMDDTDPRLIRGGTLPTLVHLLSSQGVSTDADFMTDFFRTYRYFADPIDIARLLMMRYIEIGWSMESSGSTGSSSSGLDAPTKKSGLTGWYKSSSTTSSNTSVNSAGKEMDGFLQLRVLNAFKKWIEAHPDDFSRNPGLHELVRVFLDKHVKLDPKRILFVASILKNLEERAPLMSSSVASRAAAGMTGGGFLPSKLTTHSRGASETRKPSLVNASTFSSTNSLTDHRPKSTVQQDDDDATPSSGGLSLRRGSRTSAPSSISLTLALSTLEPPKTTMSDLDPTIVAQQFTLMEHTQFRRIKIEEFYCQAWNQPQKVKSRLSSLIGWFNRVAYGVASEVVGAAKVKDRVGVLKRFIFIAHLCLKWNNFNTVFEIVAGLNLGAITRLKKTWKALPSKYWDVWNQLNRTVSDEGSYRVYRQSITLLKDRKPETPMLPYLGVNLKDLTFAEDGNPTYMTSNVINFTKFRMISRLLESIVASQRGTYEFKSDERVQGWLKEDWVCLDTNELYELSRQCEPRVPVST